MLQMQLKTHQCFRTQNLFQDVALTFPEGQLTIIFGHRNAGKSTFMRLLAGWEKPHDGHVIWNQHSLTEFSAVELAGLRAFLPQDAIYHHPALMVKDIVALGCIRSTSIRHLLVEEALNVMDLSERANILYEHLSKSEKQRVHLARCKVQLDDLIIWKDLNVETASPGWGILDEPVTYLDTVQQEKSLLYWKQYAHEGKVTIIASLHQLDLAARYADFIVVLSHGKVIAEGTPSEVLQQEIIEQIDQDK